MAMLKRKVVERVKRVKSSMAAACDINNIMRRYVKTGVVDHLAKHGASYGFVPSMTFQESMNIVRKAEEMLEDLPSDVRKRFRNSPLELMRFLDVAENLEEARKLGLAEAAKPPVEPPAPLEVTIVGGGPPAGKPA